MGLRDEREEVLDEGRRGTRLGGEGEKLKGNGMRDVWVIGEGFFRGVGGAFDVSSSGRCVDIFYTDVESSSKSIVWAFEHIDTHTNAREGKEVGSHKWTKWSSLHS